MRNLALFCKRYRMTPEQVVEPAAKDPKIVANLLENHIRMLESENKAPGTINDHMKAIKSWLRHFDTEVRRKIKIQDTNFTTMFQDEMMPIVEEMAVMYSSTNLQTSVIMSLIAKVGL